jgi:hypothetical protein
MKKITVSQIMKWHPCDRYPKERVRELIGSGKTLFEILKFAIPRADKEWVAMHILVSNKNGARIYYQIFRLWLRNELSDTQYYNRVIKATQKFLKEKAS